MKTLLGFIRVMRAMARHGGGHLADRLSSHTAARNKAFRRKDLLFSSGFPSPRRLRLMLEELGPSFIKLGQLMSTRADVFPPEYIEELNRLRDQVPPVAFDRVEAVLEEQLGRPLNEAFAEFNPDPIGSASVAQVYEAKLFTGERVAVKVTRPGVARRIRNDLPLMYFVATRIEAALEPARILGVQNVVKEFERTIFKELDMLTEAAAIDRFAANFKGSEEIHIPRVHWDYCSRPVLVMEYIDGVKMDEVEKIKAFGMDPREVALIGLRSFSRQLMEFGFFHADPHPGNTIVMPDGRVGLVDFGITGFLDEDMMRYIAGVFYGYAEHDYDIVMDSLLGAGLLDEETMDLRQFRRDLMEASEPFYGRSLQTITVKDVYNQFMTLLVMKHRVRMPRNLLLLLKTFIQTEALGKILNSDASLLQVTKPYAKKLLEREYDARKLHRAIGRSIKKLSDAGKDVPQYVHDILKQAANGHLRLEVAHNAAKTTETKLDKAINRGIIGLVVSASIVASALILNSNVDIATIHTGITGLETLSLSNALGLFGYGIATALGVWLVISILRSGRL